MSEPRAVRFGVFELDLAARELRRSGIRVKLQDQPLEVLAALLERPGEIVTKEELRARIWGDEIHVEVDRSLATAIVKVRQALGDSATRPRFVETIPKLGYRFVGGGERSRRLEPRLLFASLALAAALVATFAFVRTGDAGSGTSRGRPLVVEPLTSLPGFERYPDLSPDGNRVAFSWQREGASQSDIYVKQIDVGQPRRLTNHPDEEIQPRWSPDGRYLAFARFSTWNEGKVLRIPALGGSEVELAAFSGREWGGPRLGRFCWTPDGSGIILSDAAGDGRLRLYLVDIEQGTRTLLTNPGPDVVADIEPRLDAAGNLVFLRQTSDGDRRIFLWSLRDVRQPRGQPREVVSMPYILQSPAPSPDGAEIVFSAWAPVPGLWRAAVRGNGKPEKIAESVGRAVQPAFSPDGRHLLYSTWDWNFDIWRLEMSQPGVAAGPPARWSSSTQDDMHADYSPDGSRIAFQSSRSGSHQIWVSGADGTAAERLTLEDASFTGSPAWSPDGSQIAFDRFVGSGYGVFVMNANGSGVRQVTEPGANGVRPKWSPDGVWLYFSSFDERRGGVWRVPAAGGPAEPVSAELVGVDLLIDPDGRYLFGTKADRTVWRFDLHAPEAALEPVLGRPVLDFWVTPEGVYFTPHAGPLEPVELRFLRFSDQRDTVVAHPPLGPASRYGLSPDGRYLLFTQPRTLNGDVMWVRNYR